MSEGERAAVSLPDFLSARLTDLEASVRATKGEQMLHRVAHVDRCDWWGDMPGACTCGAVDRALADVEAKRWMLSAWPDTMGRWSVAQADAASEMRWYLMKRLASVYADHPDFNEAWRA